MQRKRHILSHPIVNARLSQLRLATTNPKDFREVGCTTQTTHKLRDAQGIHDISFVLGLEASRDLEEEPFHGVTSVSSLPYCADGLR